MKNSKKQTKDPKPNFKNYKQNQTTSKVSRATLKEENTTNPKDKGCYFTCLLKP